MKLKQGYKQTEAGVIPADWETPSIGSIASFTSGNGISVGSLSAQSSDAPIPVYGGNGIAGFTAMALVHTPVVVVGRVGQKCGEVYLTNGPAWITDNALYPRVVHRSSDMRFLAMAMSMSGLNDLKNHNDLPLVTQAILHSVLIPFPPTEVEQRLIAETLIDVDALIESLEQLLGKKRQIKEGVRQELLTGIKRLPGFSELWTETTIGDVIERIVGGGTPSRMVPGYWGGDLPWMTVKDFAHHDKHGTIEYITREGLKHSASNLIPKGILITSTRMALGKAVVFEVDVSINQDLKALFPKPSIDTRFLYYWFEANQQAIAEIGSGSTVMGISLGELRKIPFMKPSLREQQVIASVLTVMDAEIETIERKLTKARQLKQGMMQELLTGKIRLRRPPADVLLFPTKKSSSVSDLSHNIHFNEAVVIAVLSAKFGSDKFPLGRFRRTKFSYLLHRHVEHEAAGFMKKAAGPYNPRTRYGGAEKIALQNRYVRILHTEKGEGFVADEKIAQAEDYFDKWYGAAALTWLEQFRYQKNDALELLTTVDMACQDLSQAGKAATLSAVKQIIHDSPEWKAKLNRAVFSDDNITTTIQSCGQLFPIEEE